MRRQRIYCTAHGDLVFGGRCLVMGILNVTPDSFSDGGRYRDTVAAVRRAVEMVQEGADVLDIGGESTRPGSVPVAAGEQIDRVVPVIRGVRTAGVTIPISIDTTRAEVAAAALDAGADIVNDISAARELQGRADPNRDRKGAVSAQTDREPSEFNDNAAMLALLAERGVPYIMMHMQGDPQTMQVAPQYDDVVREVASFFKQRAAVLEASGVQTEGRMIVDPGIGFGKTVEHNLALLCAAGDFGENWPVLIGTSRKRFIRALLANASREDTTPMSIDPLMGTAATVAHAALSGVDMVRVHDVRAMRDVVEIMWRLQ